MRTYKILSSVLALFSATAGAPTFASDSVAASIDPKIDVSLDLGTITPRLSSSKPDERREILRLSELNPEVASVLHAGTRLRAKLAQGQLGFADFVQTLDRDCSAKYPEIWKSGQPLLKARVSANFLNGRLEHAYVRFEGIPQPLTNTLAPGVDAWNINFASVFVGGNLGTPDELAQAIETQVQAKLAALKAAGAKACNRPATSSPYEDLIGRNVAPAPAAAAGASSTAI